MVFTRRSRRYAKRMLRAPFKVARGTLSTASKANAAYATAMVAARNIRYIKGLVNSELYKYDIGTTAVAVNNSTGQVIHLSTLGQGDTDATRTGNSVLAKSILVNMDFVRNSSATITFLKCMIVIDTQQVSDTAPTISEILDQTSTLSPLNNSTVGRFKVLKNYNFSLHDNKPCTSLKFFQKMYHHIRFNGPFSTDIQKGGIYLVVLSDQPTNTPTMYYNSRLSYHDN